MCKSTTLSSKGNTTVSYCSGCQSHYIWQNSFILTFNPAQYDCFLEEIKSRMGVEDFMKFPDGVYRMMLPTPMPEVLFTFSEEEWQDFTNALFEAYYMREVYQLIN
ncbi:hypothetical protein ACL9RF_09080 [Sphingobacterium sp. Mn56C]|uniref:hypothetical protein n=1 Tax=Sphingobacterium sp. Mn56C TaxID=3395261 RepID=UPI003BD2C775